MKSNRAQITDDLLDNIHAALPPPSAPGADYHDLRTKVRAGAPTIRAAVSTLIAQKRAGVIRGGLRNRKLFWRAEEGSGAANAGA